MSKLAEKKYTPDEQMKAAYALNMCTVSVSQIVDYNDSYILEQEYDAILNNLNLEQMPKDDALLKILVELLNTITFFRIQDLKKAMIELEYQHKMKNKIWSAIPNLGLIVAGGNPITMTISLASQVGIGYMNYRREKANIALEKDKSAMELHITAIEQFNALKRELFSTAWRLADEYGFADEYRLTEKQIKQYNAILMDTDEVRKFERLEAIQDKFKAYPPFWYFLGHTANYIAGNEAFKLDEATKRYYLSRAKAYFGEYEKLNRFNLLREDQLTASFALEYIDLLMLESSRDMDKINQLLNLAVEKSGNANDIMQLCAVTFLRIGKYDEAGRLLKILVNEDYNKTTNAKLLSRLYVSEYLKSHQIALKTEYAILASRVEPEYLFPMPKDSVLSDKALQKTYLAEQKSILVREYRNAINLFMREYIIKTNQVLTPPDVSKGKRKEYFANDFNTRNRRIIDVRSALESQDAGVYIRKFSNVGFRYQYVDLLNDMLDALESLSIYRNHENKKGLGMMLRKELTNNRDLLNDTQIKLDSGTFKTDDFEVMQDKLSLTSVAGAFFDSLKNEVMRKYGGITTLFEIEEAETELIQFCREQDIPYEEVSCKTGALAAPEVSSKVLQYSIFGEENERKKVFEAMVSVARDAAKRIVKDEREAAFLVFDDPGFKNYFCNSKLSNAEIKPDVIAIIDDLTKKDFDLLLMQKGFSIVHHNGVQEMRDYSRVRYIRSGNREELSLGWPKKYVNKSVDIAQLNDLMDKLGEIVAENK